MVTKFKTLAGFRDFFGKEAVFKEHIITKLIKTFQSFGYEPLQTPHLEYYEALVTADGESETQKQIYHFLDQGQRKVGLRFDHTMPLARFVSQQQSHIVLPFRRYVIGSVFRGESPQAGRFREFSQCDFDLIGSTEISADIEILLLMASSLLNINLGSFRIHVNHRGLLDCILAKLGLMDKKNEILQITDKLSKLTPDKFFSILMTKGQLSANQAQSWLNIVTSSGSLESIKELIFKEIGFTKELEPIFSSLDYLFKKLDQSFGFSKYFKLDLSIARGLNYYTGIVYETFLENNYKLGSVTSGGRYDNLVGSFSKREMSGVGASIGLDRLLTSFDLSSVNLSSVVCVYIAILDDSAFSQANHLAFTLRELGINTELALKSSKLGKHFEYAQKKGILFLIAYGTSEKAGSALTLADLKSGQKLKFDSVKLLATHVQQVLKK